VLASLGIRLRQHPQFLTLVFRRVSKIAKKRLLASSGLSVRLCVLPSTWNNSAPTGRIFIKFDIEDFLKICRTFKFLLNRTRINGSLRADQYTLLIISRPLLFRLRNVSCKSCREYQNILANFVLSNLFPECRTVYEINWKNIVERDRPQIISFMRITCWIAKATNTHIQVL
jgi:hypothetical protein